MRTFQVDANNNFVIGADGQIPIIGGLPAVEQTAKQFSQAQQGEMVYKADEGVPYAIIAWTADPNEAAFEVAQRARLLQVPTATAVTAFLITRDGEDLKYTATLETTNGELVVNG